jgi:hypothetical protein
MNFVSEVGFITEMGWAHQTSYTPTLLIEVAVIRMESKNSLICVLGILLNYNGIVNSVLYMDQLIMKNILTETITITM